MNAVDANVDALALQNETTWVSVEPFEVNNVALLCDIMYCKAKILARHKRGINVLYGNGGAHWVDLKAFQDFKSSKGAFWRDASRLREHDNWIQRRRGRLSEEHRGGRASRRPG